jgi:hypothetical protein
MPRINTAASGGTTAVSEPPAAPAANPVPVTAPATVSAAAPGALKKVSFGKIATKKDETTVQMVQFLASKRIDPIQSLCSIDAELNLVEVEGTIREL